MVRSTLFGQKSAPAPKPDTVNKSVGAAYSGDLKQDLISLLTTNVIGDTFYATEQELAASTQELVTRGARENPEFLAKAVVYGRNEGFMRLAPIVGLAALTVHGGRRALTRQVFPRVIRTPDDLREYVTLFNTRAFGKRMTGWVTKMVGDWLNGLSEYHAVKYGSQASKTVTLRDILRQAHPKPASEAQDYLFNYLVKGTKEVSLTEPQQLKVIWAAERLKRATNESEVISLITRFRLPWEVVIPALEKSTPHTWAALAEVMPYFALLRNLATMNRNGALAIPGVADMIATKLSDPAAIARSKLFPFRFFQASRKILDLPKSIQTAVSDALETSISNLPDIDGRMVVAVDDSGSMTSHSMGAYSDLQCRDIARLLAAILYRRYGAKIAVFASNAIWSRGHEGSTRVLDAMNKITPNGGSTNLGSSVQLMLRDKVPCEVYVGLTDNESYEGHGVPTILRTYRDAMKLDTRGFLVNLQPERTYQAGVNDPLIRNISGFSDQALKFIGLQAKGGPRAQVEYVDKLDIRQYDKFVATDTSPATVDSE